MAFFEGGPYDGEDLPVDGKLNEIRLPLVHQFDQFRADRTASKNWPYVYLKDESADPPIYKYRGKLT